MQSSRPIKATFIVTHAMTADLLLKGHLGHLVANGFAVSLITSPSTDLAAIGTREGVDIFEVPMEREIAPLSDLLSLARLTRSLRQIGPELVVASTPKAGLLGLLAARRAGVPRRIYTLRGLRLETTSGIKRALLRRTESIAAAAATGVLAVSQSLRSRYLDLGLLSEADKIRVPGAGSSNGVDLERFRPLSADSVAAGRRALGLGPDDFVLGFVGRLTKDKGIGPLLEAVESLPPHCKLVLIGDQEAGDPLDAHALKTLKGLKSNQRVLHLGFRKDTEALYPTMDLLVFPSLREGLPNAPLEAAACAVATVGCRVTGTVDAVDDGLTGRLTQPNSASALREAIHLYLEDPALAQSHGRNARQRAEQLFARRKVWHAWQASYLHEMLKPL